jgi:hypothetical protein
LYSVYGAWNRGSAPIKRASGEYAAGRVDTSLAHPEYSTVGEVMHSFSPSRGRARIDRVSLIHAAIGDRK